MFKHKLKILIAICLIVFCLSFWHVKKNGCKDFKSCLVEMKENFINKTKNIIKIIKK